MSHKGIIVLFFAGTIISIAAFLVVTTIPEEVQTDPLPLLLRTPVDELKISDSVELKVEPIGTDLHIEIFDGMTATDPRP